MAKKTVKKTSLKQKSSVANEEVKSSALSSEAKSQLRKTEAWTGLAIVLILLGAGIYLKNTVFNQPKPEQSANKLVTSVTTSAEPTVSPSSTNSTKPAKLNPSSAPKKVAVLADTNGKIEVTVEEGDSFWKISKRVCGDGKYYLDIQDALGYQNLSIHKGDILTISCPN